MIDQILKSNHIKFIKANQRDYIVYTSNRQKIATKVQSILKESRVEKNVLINKNSRIFFTPEKFLPKQQTLIKGSGSENRGLFVSYATNVLQNTISNINIKLLAGISETFKDVSNVVISANHTNDVSIVSGGTRIPLGLQYKDGLYNHMVESSNIKADVLDAISYLSSRPEFDGYIDDDDKLIFRRPFAFVLDTGFIRSSIFKKLSGGYYIMGNFDKAANYSYTGKDNTLTIKCKKIFRSPMEFTGVYTPYVVVSPGQSSIGPISGVDISISPKLAIPHNVLTL